MYLYKDTEYLFALCEVGVPLDAAILVTRGGIHVPLKYHKSTTHTYK